MKRIRLIWGSITNNIVSLLKILLYSSNSNRYRFQHINLKECVILGNGPSMKLDFDKVKSKNVFAVNDFALSDYYIKLKPSYYVLVDPGYWLNKDETHDANIMLQQKLFNALTTLTTWNLTLFIPYTAYKLNRIQKILSKNHKIKILPFNTTDIKGTEKIKHWFFKENYAAPTVQNVLGAAIYLAINTGYKKIVLYGTDHSWHETLALNNSNQVCTFNSNFFSRDQQLVPWKKTNGSIYKMHEILVDLAKTFESYHQIYHYANYLNTKIINSSARSYIDAFERSINDEKNY